MNHYMKFSLFGKKAAAFLLALCALVNLTNCTEKDDELGVEYGYVQFKLYKNETAPKNSNATRGTGSDEDIPELNLYPNEQSLDYLSEVSKVKVRMLRNGSVIEQTLALHAYNDDNAAYGMRSDKLQLLAGEYELVGYTLYDKLDKETYSCDYEELVTMEVISNIPVHWK